MQTFLKSPTIESIHCVPSTLDKPMFCTLKWFKWYHCLPRKLWETTPSFELPSNSCRDGCVPFPDTFPPRSPTEKEVGSACAFLGTRTSTSARLSESLYLMSKKEKKWLWSPSPLYFVVPHPKESSSRLLSAGGPWSDVEVDVDVGWEAVQLSSALVCSAMETCAPLPGGIGSRRHGRDPSIPPFLALGLGVLRPGQASLPRWSQAGPPGARPRREASQKIACLAAR